MRTPLLRALAAPFLALACLAGHAQAPQPPEIAARNWLLYDASADQVLASKDAGVSVEPASLTQLMAAYIVFDALRAKRLEPTQTLPVSTRAWKTAGSRMFIDPKVPVSVDDLIKGMVVQSGNDATMALAEGVAGTAEHFVALMNGQAKTLGMQDTTFKNPEGLSEPGHRSSAHDLAILSARLLQDFPQYMHYFSIKKYRYSGAPIANDTNRNTLLFRDPTVDGLKTGHTDSAGYCLIASAKRDFPNLLGRRLVAVVLGTSSDSARTNEAQKLLNWGYTAWEGIKLFDAEQSVAEPPVYKGDTKTVRLGQARPIVIAVPAGTAKNLKTQVARPDPLIAPIRKGQRVGELKVLSGDRLVQEIPLVALAPVRESGLLSRAWDALRLLIK